MFWKPPYHQSCVTELFRRSPIVRYKAVVPSDGTVKDFRDIASLLTEVEPRYVWHSIGIVLIEKNSKDSDDLLLCNLFVRDCYSLI
jgi:hypothetical protein